MRDSATSSSTEPARPNAAATPEAEQESYTDRLLKAKKKAQQNRPD
jgi:hypothetical protein